MIFRKFALVACVAASCVGCVTESKSLPVSPENWGKMKGIKELEVPKHDAKPQTLIAAGLLEESKAKEPSAGPAQQNALRDESRKYYQKAIEIDPQCVQAHLQLANLYLIQDDLERAITVYQRGLQANPKSAQLWHDQAVAHCRRKDINAAAECFAKAHELDPENRHYATQYGLCLARAGKPQEAVTILTKVMSKADACFDVARMMEHLNQPELARQYLQLSLADRPNHQGAVAMMTQFDRPATAVAAAPFDAGVQRANYAAVQPSGNVPASPAAPAIQRATLLAPR